MSRFLQAEIDLKAIVNNLHLIKTLIRQLSHKNKIIAIVKADAYGHGAVEVSKVLVNHGVDYLGVAFYEEAVILREEGIKVPILLLFDREIEGVFKYNLTPVVFDVNQAYELSKHAQKRNVNLSVHIKVETGMGRLGIYEDTCEQIVNIARMPNLTIEGIMSHFPNADDYHLSMEQINKLNHLKKCLKSQKINPIYHISNSAGIFLKEALFDAVRPGIMLYGYNSNNKLEGLKPCMTVKTKILDIRRLPKNTPISYGKTFITKRDSLIGVIPIGYADGYFRNLSNKAEMLVRGRRAPVVGTVCMDLTMIDITEIPEAKINDEVIILGHKGKETITALDIAKWAETISYEVLTSLGSKAKRKYILKEEREHDIRESKKG